jgi:hypothetical protein
VATLSNFTCFRGEDVTVTFTMDPAEAVTGWALAFYVRARPEYGSAALVTRTTAAGGITITDGPGGVFAVAVPAASTLALPVGRYRYDVWRTDSGSEVMLAYGACDVLPQVRHNPLT